MDQWMTRLRTRLRRACTDNGLGSIRVSRVGRCVATTNFRQNEKSGSCWIRILNPEFCWILSILSQSDLFVFIGVDSWLLKLVESRRGSDPALQIARPRSTQHIPRLFSRLGTGRAGFLPAHLRACADLARVWPQHSGGGVRDHAHIDGPTARRVHLWFVRRQIWTARPAHDGHCFLLGHGIADRIRAEFHCISDFARALRSRHGRRMGTGRVARNGIAADANTRAVLRNSAAGLRGWLFARSLGLLGGVSALRLAWIVCRWCVTGVARGLHSRARA